MLEILLRVIRGERTYSGAVSRFESGFSESPDLPASLQVPHVLAVSTIIEITLDFARQALGSIGEKDAQRRIFEVIEKLPPAQVHRALDAMYREFRG